MLKVNSRNSRPEVFCENGALKKFTRKHLRWSLFFNKAAGLKPTALLKSTPMEVFSCEFCETCKNNSFCGNPLVAASLTFLAVNYFCEKVPS